jgi:hypothetical protein
LGLRFAGAGAPAYPLNKSLFRFGIPAGAKAHVHFSGYGTTEVVPFQNWEFFRSLLSPR